MDDQCVRRVEALLRWRRPDGQLISPSRFMPMAEQTGLIVSIGKWLIRRSCEQFMEWQSAGIPIDKMSINLSARQFTDDHLLRAIESIVEDTGVSPSAIEFEFTESVLMSDIAHTRSMLQKLKDMGFTIALDDFGTGYSSLTSVRELPIDTIKVDRSLVKNLPGAERDRQIVRVIAALAEGFDLDLVAEGVETPEQAQCLGDMGFNRVQGYLFAGPLPAFSLEQFVLGEEFKALSFRDTA
jgi:EAL domain-containing protein (putative c-di-GMP-specific phosphodiesterase class I)